LKARLRIGGINHAEDLSHWTRHVDGIGYVKRQALLGWRQRLETQIRARMPHMLPPSQEAAIRSQHEQRRNGIETEKSGVRRSAQQKREVIATKYRQEKLLLDNQAQEIRRAFAQKRTELIESKREMADSLNQWEKCHFEARRALDVYRNIRFSDYLKAVLFLAM
jgi:DNA-binding helix-hairpin-helix protein with protein kinase domain